MSNYFPKNIFLDKIFPDKIFPGQIFSWPGAVSFILGGRARKNTPVIYPLIFKHFFAHENSRRESYGIVSGQKSITFQAESDFEVKMAVASLFCIVFKLCWVKIWVIFVWFFLGVR